VGYFFNQNHLKNKKTGNQIKRKESKNSNKKFINSMKVHSIVRIHFATGLILMKFIRPMFIKVKGQNLANF
tara:strand:- start:110 stop:322 length:213 start_codon:yes stop_codon:yes gene_type:complete